MTGPVISSVAYKKGNWMRYTLWGLASVCIAILMYTFINTMNSGVSATVPEGYRFSVSNSYNSSGKLRTTYYVYDDKIIVEDESFDDGIVNRNVMIYDGLSTKSLTYNPDDTIDICELGSCHNVPKVVATIKSLLSRKIGREYIGL